MLYEVITPVAAEIRPSSMPEAPAVANVPISVPEPIAIVMKNVTIGVAFLQVSLKPGSRLPHANPISRGMIVAINASIGTDANPVAPNATNESYNFV